MRLATSMLVDDKPFYYVGDVYVDTQRHFIRRNDETIRLEPKAISLLNFLVSHQGQTCSKQAIMDTVWPHQTITDESVTRLIFVLRNALGDNAKSPIFIATVPRKGYVFLIAPSQDAPSLATTVTSHSKKVTKVSKPHYGIFAAIFIVISGVVALYYVVWHKNDIPLVLNSEPVTSSPGIEYGFTRYGKLQGYLHHNSQTVDIYLATDDKEYERVISDIWRKRSLLIFEEHAYYIRYQLGDYQIMRISVDGKHQSLYHSPTPIYDLSLAPSEKQLIFNQYENNQTTIIYQLSLNAGHVKRFSLQGQLSGRQGQHYYHPQRQQLFVDVNDGGESLLYTVSQQQPPVKMAVNGFREVSYIGSGRTANQLMLVGRYRGKSGTWEVNLDNGAVTPLITLTHGVMYDAYYSSDEGRLYYSYRNNDNTLFLLSLDGERESLPAIDSTGDEKLAVISSSGKIMFFVSDRTGQEQLYRYSHEPQSVSQLTQFDDTKIIHYSLSPDASEVAMVVSRPHHQLVIIDTNTGAITRSTQLDHVRFPLSWSNDGKRLYVSEHLRDISMYVYDSQSLEMEYKQNHIGLSAFEIAPNTVVTFDYLLRQFVEFSFDSRTSTPISEEVLQSKYLHPNNSFIDNESAIIALNTQSELTLMHYMFGRKKEALTHDIRVVNTSGRPQGFDYVTHKLIMGQESQVDGNIIAVSFAQ